MECHWWVLVPLRTRGIFCGPDWPLSFFGLIHLRIFQHFLEHAPNPQPRVYVWEFFPFGSERGCLGYDAGVCWDSLRGI